MSDPGLELPVSVQCQLLEVARSSYYYQSQHHESEENLILMQEIDRAYLAHQENGSPMMVRVLRRRGHEVNRKRVQPPDVPDGYCLTGPAALNDQASSAAP